MQKRLQARGIITKHMKNRQPKVRINTTISGEPARILIELKNRGIATSNTDAIIQALFTLYDKIVERDLKTAQLRTLREVEE